MDEKRHGEEGLHFRDAPWTAAIILHRYKNKKPSLQKKDWVIFTSPFTAFHRRLNVKHIQAGFLAYGSS
jgi:hypothetical protein